MVGIEATLAIDAIERANLAVGRHEVDAQRNSQTATVDRTEDGRWIDNRLHDIYIIFGWDEYPLMNHWTFKEDIPPHNLLQMRACSVVKNMPFIK